LLFKGKQPDVADVLFYLVFLVANLVYFHGDEAWGMGCRVLLHVAYPPLGCPHNAAPRFCYF
jgi:hypothetical protein